MQNDRPGEITHLLGRWEQGEPGAVDSLAPLVYDQLRAIAEAFLRNERPDHTLQPTAVVNEVFVDLLRLRRLAIHDREQFFCLRRADHPARLDRFGAEGKSGEARRKMDAHPLGCGTGMALQ